MKKRSFLDGYKTYDTAAGHGNAKKWQGAFKDRMSGDEAKQVLQAAESTPYDILGITPQASQAEIKKAFRQLIAKWHPDRNQYRIEEAEQMSKKIIAAYTILKN